MASKKPIPQPDPYYISPEECQKRFASFLAADPADIPIPRWHVDLLKERMARYCETGIKGISFEEFEKKSLERLKELDRLMKG
jgi:hypothetical protein